MVGTWIPQLRDGRIGLAEPQSKGALVVRLEMVQAAQDDMRRLDRSVQLKVAKKLRHVREAPEAVGKPLVGSLRGLRRVKVGDHWRIVWEVFSDDLVVVWAIGRRSGDEVYNDATRRVEGLPRGSKRDRLEAILPQLKILKDEAEALRQLVPAPQQPKAELRGRRWGPRVGRRRRHRDRRPPEDQ